MRGVPVLRSRPPFPFLPGPPEGMRSGAKPAFSLPRVLEVKELSWSVSRLLTPEPVWGSFINSLLGPTAGSVVSWLPPCLGGAGYGT